jgi:hypothetical protein
MSRIKLEICGHGYAHSLEAINGAKNLIVGIKSGGVRVNLEPIREAIGVLTSEHESFVSFRNFLRSANGELVIETLK